jgi:hypothetical protein
MVATSPYEGKKSGTKESIRSQYRWKAKTHNQKPKNIKRSNARKDQKRVRHRAPKQQKKWTYEPVKPQMTKGVNTRAPKKEMQNGFTRRSAKTHPRPYLKKQNEKRIAKHNKLLRSQSQKPRFQKKPRVTNRAL